MARDVCNVLGLGHVTNACRPWTLTRFPSVIGLHLGRLVPRGLISGKGTAYRRLADDERRDVNQDDVTLHRVKGQRGRGQAIRQLGVLAQPLHDLGQRRGSPTSDASEPR